MSLKAGIVGLPNVGKSTLFNAITNSHVLAENYPFATIDPNSGVVVVPDERLDYLCSKYNPKKKVNATFEFYDIAGLVKGASKGEGLGNQFLAAIRECDAIVEVVRCFENANVVRYNDDPVNPKNDIDVINLELSMSDLESVNNRIGKQESKARITKDKTALYEMPILLALKETLEQGTPARLTKGLSQEQMDYARKNFFLLTLKPILYVANVAEDDYGDLSNCANYQAVKEIAGQENAVCIPLSCEIEYEISQLSSPEEKQEFLETLGVKESGLDRLVKASYKLLNLSTFLTCGVDECRAWTFHNGMLAPQCAGIIHTDFEKGFIKAEVYPFEEFKKMGDSLTADTFIGNGSVGDRIEQMIREAGKIRSEGKEYVMKDGDVVFFRFNVTKKQIMRIGYGEDIHALTSGRKLILGGVHIPYEFGLDGHSDADVVYHALSDALLGSLALGDIGKYFPPTDESIAGISSGIIVSSCYKMLQEKGYRVVNVDISILAEKPHLAEYILRMRENIAHLLQTEIENVSVKAMTNEGFDAIGAKKAIKAVAVTLIDKE